ncbi:hypothetical protein U9M48_030573 [Paspalum notatum var. saurae]|uniref:DUF1618 domain-containing protein n=1 Tax=Paspalum notatum var. saurae TaxID=547442 RepID=A0AAQ3X3W1_PASNO
MGEELRLLSIPPPIHAEDPVSPPPESILIDVYGHLNDRINDTTAEGFTRDGKRIQISFWAAEPPRISCFTVRCPDLKHNPFGSMPKILSTEDDLVLLRVPICPGNGHQDARNNDYFVYQAGTKNKPPSLRLIPTSPPFFSDRQVVILRCRDQDMFFLTVARNRPFTEKQFDLHVYNSKTERWGARSIHVDSPNFDYEYAHKVTTIGGELGSVGWVDLWRGILIYDVLLDNNSLRYIPLPPPALPRCGLPKLVRNIVVLHGCIKFFQLTQGWEAATMKMDISDIGSGNKWEDEFRINFLDVPVSRVAYAQMLDGPNHLQEGEDKEPNLASLCPFSPALSLHDDAIVYVMSKHNYMEDTALVIALDMGNRTLEGMAYFCSGRCVIPYGSTYIQSGISKHLGIWSSTRNGVNAAETNRDVAASSDEVSEGVI